jgi:hypothetical protein
MSTTEHKKKKKKSRTATIEAVADDDSTGALAALSAGVNDVEPSLVRPTSARRKKKPVKDVAQAAEAARAQGG